MYDHTKQYRCTIIRGKSQKDMDDLLPAYALVIDEICPCPAEEFDHLFNNSFQQYLPESDRIKKTLDNHRTEISGKLFGMYYRADDGMVYESQRTMKYLEDSDQPAFFKDICYKMQFPNGMDKSQTVISRMNEMISIRPNSFVLKLLQLAETMNQPINVKDIGYYVLNALDVLQGKANPYEVLAAIVDDHNTGLQREIKAYDADGTPKAQSYTMQHIREQLNLLELANLIRITDEKRVILNPKEKDTIELFASCWDKKPLFDVYSYDLSSVENRKIFQNDWVLYYSKLSEHSDSFATNAEALVVQQDSSGEQPQTPVQHGTDLTELGDEGESLVYNYEKARVAAYNTRLANKVLSLGKTKGLGFDIQSVVAEPGPMEEFVKYIEVKSTKRLTVPDMNDSLWIDTLNITRNEWVAAQQHKEFYSIFRVYFTQNGATVFVITNVADKMNSGLIHTTPITYRLEFSKTSVDSSFNV